MAPTSLVDTGLAAALAWLAAATADADAALPAACAAVLGFAALEGTAAVPLAAADADAAVPASGAAAAAPGMALRVRAHTAMHPTV